MEFDRAVVEKNLKEYTGLMNSLKQMKLNYTFLYNINSLEEYEEQIQECDAEISNLKLQIEQLELEDVDSIEKVEKLKSIKTKYELLIKKNDILYDAWNTYTQIKELEGIIVRSVSQPVAKKRNEDIHSLFTEANNDVELESYIDAVCIYMYKVPLLVALITKNPSEIEQDFQISSLPEEARKKIINIIEQKKIRIENNLILSDKALIDLIEHTTGENIANQQRHNERVDTGFNRQFNGQMLIERGDGYNLLKNQRNWDRATTGVQIKRFNEMSQSEQFPRKDSDILTRNFPQLSSEDLVYRSFKSMPNDRKRDLITAVLYNLELCYEMFKSYYVSDKFEVPAFLTLTNEEVVPFSYKFTAGNISHILGIPSTNIYEKSTGYYTGQPNLPQATINLLGVTNASALKVLESILEKKDKIIEQCGLNFDSITNSYYEMLPWERIILKTNAFIRGDFFKTTALISGINQNSFLIKPTDNIRRISITPTNFSGSALNQELLDPNMSFDEAISIIKSRTTKKDFTFKGMSFDERDGIWYPKTNASAIGERIQPNNSTVLKTLEKYRYLFSGNIAPNDGGFIAGVESPISEDLSKEYSVQEMVNSLVDIANSFGTTAEVEYNLRGYLEQIQNISNKQKKS